MTSIRDLAPDLQAFVTQKLDSGDYEDEQALLEAAIAALKAQDDALRELLAARIAEADAGAFSDRSIADIIEHKKREFDAQ